MFRVGVFLASLAAIASAPAAAVEFIVDYGPTAAIPSNNDFRGQLNALGLYRYATNGATLALSGRGKVTFEYMASESGFVDSFAAGPVSATETNKPWGAVPIGSAVFAGGAITDWEFTSNKGKSALPGDDGFGIFLPRLREGADSLYRSSVVYFGYDDQITDIDDNHDDFIIRATVSAIPEPATWGMMIAGFGLVGLAARRRTPAVLA